MPTDPTVSVPDAAMLRAIAARFLPSRYHCIYSRIKLATDPLYAAVARTLACTTEPVLDLGCGLGLLVHYLRAAGIALPHAGMDNDARKIALARQAAQRAQLADCRFDAVDLRHDFPRHAGSVAILDMLQFMTAERRATLLVQAAACVTAQGRLVIRTGLADGGWRATVTRTVDVFARAVRWMNSAPVAYPTGSELTSLLRDLGFATELTPLWGDTPFNNWLLVARRT